VISDCSFRDGLLDEIRAVTLHRISIGKRKLVVQIPLCSLVLAWLSAFLKFLSNYLLLFLLP
jgi:hypothetical protein